MSRAPRILVFDPYLPALGGGERYALAIARAAASIGTVTFGGPPPDADRLALFGLEWPCEFRAMDTAEFTAASAEFDVAVVITNSAPPMSRARQSVLVVQFPNERLDAGVAPLTALSRRQRLREAYGTVIVYSEFVRRWLQERWGMDSLVVAPPIEIGSYEPARKRNRILTVGRFFVGAHSKRHDMLVRAFAALEPVLADDWHLVVAGGAMREESTDRYIRDVTRAASGHRIELRENAPAAELRELYATSRIYWHATGFGRQPDEPQKAEHFGMTTVEAMSYGAVPVVYGDGGQLEIVSAGVGCVWRTVDELIAATRELADDRERLHRVAVEAFRASASYSFETFARKLLDVREFQSSMVPRFQSSGMNS